MAYSRKPRPQRSPLAREAQRRTTPPERLRELVEHPKIHRILSRNPSAPPDVLRQLAETTDKATLHGVAKNRSTPEDVMRTICSNASERLGCVIARRTKLPDSACVVLAGSPYYSVRWALVRRAALPIPAIETLSTSTESTILRRLVRHVSTPAATLARFAADPDPTWALDALPHPNMDRATIAALAKHRDPAVRDAAIAVLSKHSDSAVRDAAVRDAANVVAQPIQDDENAPVVDDAGISRSQSSWRQLLRSPDHRERALAVGKLSNLTPAESERAASDACWLVRQAVARRGDTGPAILTSLVNDRSLEVRVLVAGHPSTPAEALDELAKIAAQPKVANRIARNDNAAPETLEHLALRWTSVHNAIARHPAVSVALLWQLAESGAGRAIRIAVARSANVDRRICVRAATDAEATVRRALAANNAATAASLLMMASDDDRRVRLKLAGNPSTPSTVLNQLAADPEASVRKAVAHNPTAPSADRVMAALL